VIENIILSIGKDEFGDVLFAAFHRKMRARQDLHDPAPARGRDLPLALPRSK
jgi:hypothetical protein